MNRLFSTLLVLYVTLASPSWAQTIEAGQVLLLKAQISYCDAPAVPVDFVEVPASGAVVFFARFSADAAVRVSVTGRSGIEVANELADKLERRDGYRPQTIEIVVLSGADIIAAKGELLEAAARKVLMPCLDRPPVLEKNQRDEAPDPLPLETRNLAQQM